MADANAIRQPRGLLKVNGQSMLYDSWEVDNNVHYTADTFRASVPTSGQASGFDAAWWSAQAKLSVEIYGGIPTDPNSFTASDLTLLFKGAAEDFDYDPAARHIDISGRDRTGELIDTKTSEKYANLTSSKIVSKIAGAHGFTPQITATSTLVGRYYTQDLVRIQTERSEWDLITWLAREEGFDTYVQGDTLYFGPKADASSPYTFTWTAPDPTIPRFSQSRIKFSRNFNLAKDITVNVRSWDPKRKQGFTKTAKATHTKSPVLKGQGGPVYDQQTYSYTIANLNPDQAQARANQILHELSLHELKVSIDGPATNDLLVSDTFAVAGTGTFFDQTYYPDSIVRSMDAEGYKWRITGKNHPTESEPSL